MITIRNEVLERLKNTVQPFKGFSNDELKVFLKLMEPATFKALHTVFEENAPSEKMFIIISGEVIISKYMGKKDGEPRSVVLATLKPGECFGEMGMIDGRPRSAKAHVTKDTVLLSITKTKLFILAKSPKYSILSFKLFYNFTSTLVERLRETDSRIVELSTNIRNR